MGGLCNTDGCKVNNYIEIYLNAKQSDQVDIPLK